MHNIDTQIAHAEKMLRQARRDRGSAWSLPLCTRQSEAGRALILEAVGRVHMWADELERLCIARQAAEAASQLLLPEVN